jgi:hypothetical protein
MVSKRADDGVSAMQQPYDTLKRLQASGFRPQVHLKRLLEYNLKTLLEACQGST